MTEDVSIETLADVAEGCVSCPLYEGATQTVFGTGSLMPRLMLVGEQPGDVEDRQGVPFVGPAGGVLDRAMEDAGLDRGECYLTNAVKHFNWKAGPPGKPRLHAKPNRAEISACYPWLEAELEALNPDVVVTLGATATSALLGPDVRVTRDHGVPIALQGRTALATIHPAAVLRAGQARQDMYEQLVGDLSVANGLVAP